MPAPRPRPRKQACRERDDDQDAINQSDDFHDFDHPEALPLSWRMLAYANGYGPRRRRRVLQVTRLGTACALGTREALGLAVESWGGVGFLPSTMPPAGCTVWSVFPAATDPLLSRRGKNSCSISWSTISKGCFASHRAWRDKIGEIETHPNGRFGWFPRSGSEQGRALGAALIG